MAPAASAEVTPVAPIATANAAAEAGVIVIAPNAIATTAVPTMGFTATLAAINCPTATKNGVVIIAK